jgi:DNA-binding transcriptional LysR family regulator
MQWDERIGRRLKLRDLHILMSVAQFGTMGKAAEQLAISQPAVSKAIADIEHVLKVRLLDRTAHGVEPTLYGRSLLKWGVAVFDDLRQGVKEIEHLADPTVGELRIGCTEPMAWGVVPAVIERLTRQYPRLVFHVTEADPATLRYRELRERNVELVIGRIAGPVPDEEVNAAILFEEKAFVVAGSQNRWVGRRKIQLADLADELWSVGGPDSFPGSLLAEGFRAAGLPPPRISSVSFSIPLHNALLASGRFLSVLPGSLLRFSANRMALKVLPVKLPVRAGPVGILTLKNRMLSPVAQLFFECVHEVVKPLAKAR